MKNHLLPITLFSLTFIVTSVSYVFLGERSLLVRVSLIALLIEIVLGALTYRKQLAQKMKRGKASRAKLIEGCALLFFGGAVITLINSFDLNVDWTTRQLFRLSPESKNIIKNIPSPLKITLFSYKEEGLQGLTDYAQKLAERYEASDPSRIIFEIVDPVKNKSKSDEYGIRQNGTLVFEMEGRREYVAPNLLVENLGDNEISYKGETIFSAVIDKLNNNKEINIYYLTGHGELDFESSGLGGYDGIQQLLIDRRYNIRAINLDHYPDMPKDSDILIIADPKTKLSPQTYLSIEKYIKNGGNMLYLLSERTIADLNLLLMESGFIFLPNVAVDPSRVAKNSGEFSIIPTLSPESEITLLLRNKKKSVIFPSASVVYSLPKELSDTNKIYDIRPLARMSQNGFGERSFATGLYEEDEKDITGIYCLAISSIIAEKENLDQQRRAIIFGSTDFIDNARLYTGGNSEFFINSVDFLLRKDLKTTIAPKIEDLSQTVPQPEQIRMIFIIVVSWVGLWAILALSILIKRKNKVKK